MSDSDSAADTDSAAELVDTAGLDAVATFVTTNSDDIDDLEAQLNRITLALGDLLDERQSELEDEIAGLEERKAAIEAELDDGDETAADSNDPTDDQLRGYW